MQAVKGAASSCRGTVALVTAVLLCAVVVWPAAQRCSAHASLQRRSYTSQPSFYVRACLQGMQRMGLARWGAQRWRGQASAVTGRRAPGLRESDITAARNSMGQKSTQRKAYVVIPGYLLLSNHREPALPLQSCVQ